MFYGRSKPFSPCLYSSIHLKCSFLGYSCVIEVGIEVSLGEVKDYSLQREKLSLLILLSCLTMEQNAKADDVNTLLRVQKDLMKQKYVVLNNNRSRTITKLKRYY